MRTLYRELVRLEEEGMASLFGAEAAGRRGLPPAMRRLVVDPKAEYPGFDPNEIANVRLGRRPDRKTVRKAPEQGPIPLRFVRRFPPYEEVDDPSERGLDEYGDEMARHHRGRLPRTGRAPLRRTPFSA